MDGQEQTDLQTKPPEEPEHVEVVPIEAGALEAMERATIDVQITTAKKYPRSITKFIKQASEMVSVDQQTALSCIYRRPVGKEGGRVTYAEGESIRLAEIVAASYGNLRVAGIVTEMNPRFVKVMGFAHDLETNYAVRAEVIESTVKRNGQPYSERMRIVAAKAAQSKAIRDAIFRVVPKSLCKPITELSRKIALGEGMTMEQRRARAAEWISKISVPPERIFAALGVAGVEEMGEKELLILTGVKTAIADGDVTADEAFPLIVTEQSEAERGKGVNGLKDLLDKNKTPGDDLPDPEHEARIKTEQEKLTAAGSKTKSKKTKKKPQQDETEAEAVAESPLSLYICQSKKCKAEFNEPKLSGEGETLTSICPHCLTPNIKLRADLAKTD